MNKQQFMKQQNCVLKVNIQCACDGCEQKVKKTLNKIDGVHKTSIDLEQGKVTVYGNADPATLIKKLKKSGKHAELWGPQKGVNFINNRFKSIDFDNKNQKGAGGKGHQQMQPTKGFEDFMPSIKDQKSVKFNLPAGSGRFDGEDVFDDEDDDFDDEFDEVDDDSFDGHDHKKPNKMMMMMMMIMNGRNGSSGGFELPLEMKGKGGGYDGKKGNGKIKGGHGGEKESGKMSKGSRGGGGLFRNFGGYKKKQGGDGSAGWHMKDGSWGKKGGKHQDDGKFGNSNKQNEFLDFRKPQNGGGGRNFGHNGGRSMSQMGGNPMMGQMGYYPMGQMPMTQMGYRGQGMDDGNPYNQQKYMPSSVMMNQYKANVYPPQMMYGMTPPASYGPPIEAHGNDNMTHMFSDENTDSCSIM